MEHRKVEQLQGPDENNQKDQIYRTAHRYCREARTRLDKCLQECHVYENLNITAKYLTSRPLLLVCVVAVVSAIALPVLAFTVFAITTIACTFTGFIVIEGTILAFGTFVLCGVLLSVIAMTLMLGTCLALAYYVCLRAYTVMKNV